MKGKCEDRKDYIHCEVEGAIINIREGLHDLHGRKMTSIEILPHEFPSWEPKWRVIPNITNISGTEVRVVQSAEPESSQEKVKQIKTWYQEGKIKRLGTGMFSVPSEAFALGITPRLVSEVLEKRR